MSKLDDLKKQYPHLNVSIIDMLSKLEKTNTYKYLPLLCKLFTGPFKFDTQISFEHITNFKNEIDNELSLYGFSLNGLSYDEKYTIYKFLDFFNKYDLEIFQEFQEYNERGLIPNNDVTSYKDISEIYHSVSIASMKKYEKELEKQIFTEFEDEIWLIIRPLTHQASSKYGASTKWCTTSKNEPEYFEKYWRDGVLVYFINKSTGYKFAGYKSILGDEPLSFWNAEDKRIDYLDVDADIYLLPITKKIFKSDKTNKELCSVDLISQVNNECSNNLKHRGISTNEIDMLLVPPDTYPL